MGYLITSSISKAPNIFLNIIITVYAVSLPVMPHDNLKSRTVVMK